MPQQSEVTSGIAIAILAMWQRLIAFPLVFSVIKRNHKELAEKQCDDWCNTAEDIMNKESAA